MNWDLVLEFVKALAWPMVVGTALIAFRRQLAKKLEDLTGVDTPLGKATFDKQAKQIEEHADRAASHEGSRPVERRGPELEPPASSGEHQTVPGDEPHKPSTQPQPPSSSTADRGVVDEDGLRTRSVRNGVSIRESVEERNLFLAIASAAEHLNKPPDFTTAFEVASTSPQASVMLAYSDLERVCRSAWTIGQMQTPPPNLSMTRMLDALTASGNLGSEFAEVARDLSELRNQIAHGSGSLSTAGAIDFIQACRRLSDALTGQALSRLRHPSRAGLIGRWLEFYSARDMDQGSGEE